ncbi:hypothetical protein Pelo_15308 [Pelomyxa schiedti]|nr:hypothetical protein Pelo_15308 [Pelomyxa schiedti]
MWADFGRTWVTPTATEVAFTLPRCSVSKLRGEEEGAVCPEEEEDCAGGGYSMLDFDVPELRVMMGKSPTLGVVWFSCCRALDRDCWIAGNIGPRKFLEVVTRNQSYWIRPATVTPSPGGRPLPPSTVATIYHTFVHGSISTRANRNWIVIIESSLMRVWRLDNGDALEPYASIPTKSHFRVAMFSAVDSNILLAFGNNKDYSRGCIWHVNLWESFVSRSLVLKKTVSIPYGDPIDALVGEDICTIHRSRSPELLCVENPETFTHHIFNATNLDTPCFSIHKQPKGEHIALPLQSGAIAKYTFCKDTKSWCISLLNASTGGFVGEVTAKVVPQTNTRAKRNDEPCMNTGIPTSVGYTAWGRKPQKKKKLKGKRR